MSKNLEKVVKILTERNETIATMESCTGGGLANAVTNIPGASEVLHFSAITYCNDAKVDMGVSRETIDRYTVYSAEVAKEMSMVIAKKANATYGVGITGTLKRFDPRNSSNTNDVVYFNIYDTTSNKSYSDIVKVSYDTREENKKQVIDCITKTLLKILKTQ